VTRGVILSPWMPEPATQYEAGGRHDAGELSAVDRQR